MHTYASKTFSEIIPDIVKKYAGNRAVGFFEEDHLTYEELGREIESMQAFLEDLGVQPGDKVAIYSQNMPNWVVVYFALQCMGVVAVPILPDFNSHELENVLNHSGAGVLFISESLTYRLDDVEPESLDTVISLNDFSIISTSKKRPVYRQNRKPSKTYSPDADKLSILIYTSGTTGGSKGVMLSQKNVIVNTFQSAGVQEINEKERFLSVLPLSHSYENTIGLLLPMFHGACVTYLRKPPTSSVLLPALKKIRPHFMLTVPMIIEKVYRNSVLPQIESKAVTRVLHKFFLTRKLLYRIAGKKLYQTFGGRLKFFGIGGAKLDGVVERFLREAKFPYAIGYGLTETSPLLAGSNPSNTWFQAIGPAVEQCQLKINDPDPVTGEGEVWAKGPNIMLGYYKNPEETKAKLTEDGWFKTGDLGVFDKKGRLYHKGRLKNLIVGANGENIYPEEIESLINNFHHVVESIVIKKKGKLVALVHFNREEVEERVRGMTEGITHRVDQMLDELAAELQQHINKRVNKYSRIQLLVVHPDPFQKTATKKIKRYLYG